VFSLLFGFSTEGDAKEEVLIITRSCVVALETAGNGDEIMPLTLFEQIFWRDVIMCKGPNVPQ
jgi:hypothetical protein